MVPDRGDIHWVDFDPVLGSEQGRRRPALILSPRLFHETSHRALVCPVSSRVRNWPTEIALPPGMATIGVVMADQLRTIDRRFRMFGFIERAPDQVVQRAQSVLARLIGIPLPGDP